MKSVKENLIDYIKNAQLERPENVDDWYEAITSLGSVFEDIENYFEQKEKDLIGEEDDDMESKLSKGDIFDEAAESMKSDFESREKDANLQEVLDLIKNYYSDDVEDANTDGFDKKLARIYQRGFEDGQKESKQKLKEYGDQIIVLRKKNLGSYQRGYNDGRDDPIRRGITEAKIDEARAEGRKEAWEAARKIVWNEMDGGYSYNELNKILGITCMGDIFKVTADDAIEKFAAYEKKEAEQEIKVGDEIQFNFADEEMTGIVLQIIDLDDGGGYKVLCKSDQGQIVNKTIFSARRTGRHFSQIGEILKQMQEGN